MAPWLSEEWAAEVAALTASLPPAAGASGTVSWAWAAAPKREVALRWAYAGGRPGPGEAGADPEADLALSIAAADAADLVSGRVEPSVAFMRGRLKATGAGGLLLAFLASTVTSDFGTWLDRVAAVAPPP